MNQTGWIILLSLIVWSKCDPFEFESSHLAQDHDVWQTTNDDESTLEPTTTIEDHSQTMEQDEEDIDPSASSNVQTVKNQSDELSASLAHLIKRHNLYPQLESLKKNQHNLLNNASDKQKQLVNDLLKRMGDNSPTNNNSAGDASENKNSKTYDINDLKKYYDQIKMDESQGQSSNEPQTNEPNQDQYHANHNYFSKGDWRPLISTADNRYAPLTMQHDPYQVPSQRVASYVTSNTNEMPNALANFYVDSDHRLLHAYESQNKDLKETVKETGSSIATVKDHLISTKDPSKDKLSAVSHKQGGYVPVEGDKYQEYMSCCEQLFKYANKDIYHEDIYLVPKGEDPRKFHPMIMSHHPMKPGSYLPGYPLMEPEVKLVGPPGAKHHPVHCLDEHHHHLPHRSGHIMPMYHHASHPHPIFHHPPATLLLKKKLALIGKKYFLGK